MPSRLRRTARLGAVAAVAVAGSLAAASAASAAPAMTVSTANGAGGTVMISGTGFEQGYAPAPGTGAPGVKAGFYIAQGVVSGGTVTLGTGSKWISAGNAATDTRDGLASDGSFKTTFPVSTTVTTTTGTVDCTTATCVILAWPSQSNPAATGLIAQTNLAFGPSLTAPSTPITAGDSVTVSGAGFAQSYTAAPGTGAPGAHAGFYVTQAALVDGVVKIGGQSATKWVNGSAAVGDAGQAKLELDGSFTTSFVSAQTVGGTDCTTTQCFFIAWPAQSNPTIANSIVLTGALKINAASTTPTDPGNPSTGGGTPAISVSPNAGLSTAGPTTVSVNGSGFNPTANTGVGVYVMYGPVGATQQSQFYSAKWVAPGNPVAAGTDVMSSTGTFSTSVDVVPSYTDGTGTLVNCTVVQCAVSTIAAHQYGATDRSQDTRQLITFAGTVASSTDAPAAQTPLVPDAVPTTAPSTAPNPNAADPLVGPKVTKAVVGKRGKASLKVSEPSTVTFTVRKKVGGKYVVVKTIKVTAKQAGTVSANLKITKKGLYRISIQAKGSNGGTKTVVKSLRVG